MPRVRYGPDITDDAASLELDEDRLRKQLRRLTRGTPAYNRVLEQLNANRLATQIVFGNRENRRTMARESVRRQGYLSDAEVRELGVARSRQLRGRRAGDQFNLARTPGRRSQAIPGKKGYKARPQTENPELFRSATRKARSAEARKYLSQLREQPSTRRAAAKKATKAAAKKATAAKKAARPRKATRPRKAL